MLLVPFVILAQESKDLESFAKMEIAVKAPMNVKVLVDNQSVFAKDLVLLPDLDYKKMDLAANWGTVSGKTVFMPESNKAVVDCFFSFRKVELEQLLEFKTAMDESEDGDMVEAGLYDLVIKTSRSKYMTVNVEFTLNGKTIKRNINFAFDKVITKDSEYDSFSEGELPMFKVTITDELLGIPTLKFKAKSELPFDCLVKNEQIGISFVVDASKEDTVVVLAPNLPKDGVYNFEVYFSVGSYFVPKINFPFLINDGNISLKDNPFKPAAIAGEPEKKNSMVTLRNDRNVPITVLIPAEYKGKNSGSLGKQKNFAVSVSGSSKMGWEAISIAPHSSTKVWLKKTFFNGIVVCEDRTEVRTFHVETKPSQTIAIGW